MRERKGRKETRLEEKLRGEERQREAGRRVKQGE